MKIETFSSDKKIIHSGTTILFNNDSDLIFKLSTESDDFNFDLKLVFKDDKENNLQVNNIKEKNNTQMSKSQRNTIKENQKIKWRIQIPKINLDVHIMEGTSSNILLKAVGHFETTEKWIGNVGLAAHNRGYNCNFFEKIK